MACTLEIYTRDFNTKLTELTRYQLGERSWVINGVGSCDFRIGLSETNATARNLHIGNIVFIKSDTGCPVWCGRIDQVKFDNPDSVSVFCNSREVILRGVRAGSTIHNTYDMVNILNVISIYASRKSVVTLGVTPGDIYSEQLKEPLQAEVTNNFLDGTLAELAKRLDAEWHVDHQTGMFNLQKKLGSDKSALVQIEQSPDVVEHPQMTATSDSLVWFVRSQGGNFPEGNQAYIEISDDDVREFLAGDLRERVIDFPDSTNIAFLKEQAENTIKDSMRDLFTFDMSINNTRSLWKNIRLGDTIGISVFTMAFGIIKEKMRVFGMAVVNEESPQMRLVLKPLNPKDFFRYFK